MKNGCGGFYLLIVKELILWFFQKGNAGIQRILS